MNQRDSSGLPLRAMVMVLLFLGVVFLLVGFQAMGSGDDSAPTNRRSTTVAPRRPPRADVRAAGAGRQGRGAGLQHLRDRRRRREHRHPAAGRRLERHRDRKPRPCEGVTATTVYFGDAPGEREAADEVGQTARGAGGAAGARAGRATAGRDRGGHRLGSCACSGPSPPPPCSPCPPSSLSACTPPTSRSRRSRAPRRRSGPVRRRRRPRPAEGEGTAGRGPAARS